MASVDQGRLRANAWRDLLRGASPDLADDRHRRVIRCTGGRDGGGVAKAGGRLQRLDTLAVVGPGFGATMGSGLGAEGSRSRDGTHTQDMSKTLHC
jgi:hypothetical protein